MDKIAKKLVNQLASKFGYTIFPTWRLESFELATHLSKVFERYEVTTVFDVGANAGQYHDFLREQVGFAGKIYSFEPLPDLATALKLRQADDPLWEIHNCGLGSSNGELTLNVMARRTFSSFRQPASDNCPDFSASNTVVDRVKVPVRRLDDLFPREDLKRQSCYLKVDTQGFDLEVLRGAPELLKLTKALQFELAVQHLYSEVPSYKDMLGIVEGMGFSLSGLFPVCQDSDFRAVEFDCVMVKNTVLPS
jgi:FkbM family methyltransferase